MNHCLSLLFTIILCLCETLCSGQDSLPGKIEVNKITGRYKEGMITLVLKKNHKFKEVWVAPRSIVYKGVWEIRNDTLFCFLVHCNTIIADRGKKFKERPVQHRLIVSGGNIYRIVGTERILFSTYPKKP